MALLEQVIVEAESAQTLVQDDGRVTGEDDRRAILDHVMRIRALVKRVEATLGPRILDPSSKPSGYASRPTSTLIEHEESGQRGLERLHLDRATPGLKGRGPV